MLTPTATKKVKRTAKAVAKKEARKEVKKEHRKDAQGNSLRVFRETRSVNRPKAVRKGPPRDFRMAAVKAFCSQLLNPLTREETQRSMVPYPRQQPEEVTMFRLKYNMLLGYGSDLVEADPRRGVAATIMYPNITLPLWIWEVGGALGDPVKYGVVVRQPQTPVSGLPPTGTTEVDEAVSTNTFEMDNSQFLNIQGLYNYDDEQDSAGRIMCGASDPNGNPFWGMPFEFVAADSAFTATFIISAPQAIPSGAEFEVQLVSTHGIETFTSTATVSALQSVEFVATWTGAPAHGGKYGCVLPESPLGFRIKCVTHTIYPDSVRVAFLQQEDTHLGRWIPKFPLSAKSSFDFVDAYNVVAMGQLISYEGSNFLNGGARAGVLYRGGNSALGDGLTSLANVASSLGGVERPMKVGLYQWWKPADEEDMAFRKRKDLIKTYSMPTIINYWQMADPTQLRALRLNAQIIVEAKTLDTTRQTMTPTANPNGVAEIANLVAHVPTVMDNPKHWGIIGKFLKSAFERGSQVVNYYRENAHWINPALGAVAAMV